MTGPDPAGAGRLASLASLAAPVTLANGFILSGYAETGGPGGNLKHPPRNPWHASLGSTATQTEVPPVSTPPATLYQFLTHISDKSVMEMTEIDRESKEAMKLIESRSFREFQR